MLIQIAIGTALTVVTVLLATVLMTIALEVFHRVHQRLWTGHVFVKNVLALSAMTLALLCVLTLVMWIWTAAYLMLGVFETTEEALYFSMVSFTTLGFSDIASDDWRILSGFVATDGFILFGLSTAFMFEAITEVRRVHREHRSQKHQPARPR